MAATSYTGEGHLIYVLGETAFSLRAVADSSRRPSDLEVHQHSGCRADAGLRGGWQPWALLSLHAPHSRGTGGNERGPGAQRGRDTAWAPGRQHSPQVPRWGQGMPLRPGLGFCWRPLCSPSALLPAVGLLTLSAWECDVGSLRESVAHVSSSCPQVSSGEQVSPCRVRPFRTRRESHRQRRELLGGAEKKWVPSVPRTSALPLRPVSLGKCCRKSKMGNLAELVFLSRTRQLPCDNLVRGSAEGPGRSAGDFGVITRCQ